MQQKPYMQQKPDICIVGSGAAGAFLAHALKDSSLSITILETGNDYPDQDFSTYISEKDSNLGFKNYGFSRQTGGSTNFWAGRVAPMEPIDLNHPHLPQQDHWPISIEELIPYYDEVSKILKIPDYKYFSNPNTSDTPLLSSQDNQHIEIKKFIWSSPPFNARKSIINNIEEDAQNIQIIKNAHVTQLFEHDDKAEIKFIEFVDNNGESHILEANHFVLATGGLETPRLLLNSTHKHPEGIGNSNDCVGRYFSTHPKADMAVLILKTPIKTNHALFTDFDNQDFKSRFGLGFTSVAMQHNDLLNHYTQLTPMLEYTASRFFETVKDSNSLNSPFINKNKILSGFVHGLGLTLYEFIGRLGGIQRKTKKFLLRMFLDQYPSAENRVCLSNELDAFGKRKAAIKWNFTDKDKKNVISFIKNLDAYFQSNNLGYIEYSKLEELEEWPLNALHSHFLGTTRMGIDPKHSVVNKDCMVHGYENLFIAGPSTFTSYGYANPVYTIAAISLRLGQHLKNRCK